MTDTRKPNLFIVGAPKCGTSSMYYYLLHQPDIYFPHSPDIETLIRDPLAKGVEAIYLANQLKEPHFFGSDLHFAPRHRAATTEDDYLRLFAGATNERYVGEASVWYLCSRNAAAEIKRFQPDARIIIMLRNPVDVMFRLHGQECLNGTETISDFEAALEAEPGRIQDPASLPGEPDLREALFYRRSVSFTEQVKRYLDHFGRERTHVVIFDDLRADSAKVYRDTLRFLEVHDAVDVPPVQANPMSDVRSVRLQRFFSRPSPLARSAVRALISRPARQWIASRLIRFNVHSGSKPSLSASIRERLQEELRDEVRQLSDLLERDLTGWCLE